MKPRHVLLALALGALVFCLYLPTVRNGFIGFDDDHYIYENPQVLRGLTGETALWALTSIEHANWYPLRRLSHLVDVSLFGIWAGGHHLVSAAWHAGAAALLFLALRLMTGALWRSFVVAGLFAVHPLQVESVAWAAERSNVQAGFFFALTLLLWTRYARRPGAGRYAAALASAALGIVAKPALMTLPALLLLLDVWPLGRAAAAGRGPRGLTLRVLGRLLLEQAPLFALAAASGAVAVAAHRQIGALQSLDTMPAATRLGNAMLSCWRYLGKLIWPFDLAVYYPHPGRDLPLGLAAVAGLGLVALIALVLARARRRPWLAAGWLWYLGMLAPMSGIVQFGSFAMADRFAYLPCIGLFAAVVWSAAEGIPRPLRRPAVLAGAATAALAAFSAVTVVQTGFWRDSVTLFRHTLRVTSNNFLIENSLGAALDEVGQREEAMAHYRESLRLRPGFVEARYNLALALDEAGRREEAVTHYRDALWLLPGNVEVQNNLGVALAGLKRFQEAVPHFEEALRLRPGFLEARNNLANTLLRLGRLEEAVIQYREFLRLRPGVSEAHRNLASALARLGRHDEAAAHRREAERLRRP